MGAANVFVCFYGLFGEGSAGRNKLKVFSFFPGDRKNERLGGPNYCDRGFDLSA